MKVIDVIKKVPKEEMPKKLPPFKNTEQNEAIFNICFEENLKAEGYNQARTELLNTEIDISKVVDVGKLEKFVSIAFHKFWQKENWNKEGEKIAIKKMIAQSIKDNINDCLKDRGRRIGD